MRDFHPVANLFPLMEGDDYNALVADIAEHGQHDPIWLHPDGSIIDGRNRYRACMDLGIAPTYRTWDGNGSLVSFVVSLNLHRRHLTASQRAAIALDVLPMLEAEARERQESTRFGGGGNNSTTDTGKARDHAAAMFNVNPRYVSDAKRLQNEAPDLLDRVRGGNVKLNQATRQLKERKREQRREQNRRIVKLAPSPAEAFNNARFATIVIDPPWDWGDEGDVDQFGRARPTYATMSFDELLMLPVSSIADTDCHLYLWITNRSLPKGFALLEAWGFRYVTCITWVKPHFGMGNYFRGQTEHILFGVKGSQPLARHDVGTVIYAKRGVGGHSSKPAEFYDLIETCSPGPYLDMFSRQVRDGWTTWGENG